MVRKIKVEINFDKRWLYTFIVVGILAIIGVGVYAVGGVSHSSDEITEVDPTVNNSVKDGVDWTELTGIPSDFADGVDNMGDVTKTIGIWKCLSYDCSCGPQPYCNGQIIYQETQPYCGCGFSIMGECKASGTYPCPNLGYLVE